jgi:hypothetical protein
MNCICIARHMHVTIDEFRCQRRIVAFGYPSATDIVDVHQGHWGRWADFRTQIQSLFQSELANYRWGIEGYWIVRWCENSDDDAKRFAKRLRPYLDPELVKQDWWCSECTDHYVYKQRWAHDYGFDPRLHPFDKLRGCGECRRLYCHLHELKSCCGQSLLIGGSDD